MRSLLVLALVLLATVVVAFLTGSELLGWLVFVASLIGLWRWWRVRRSNSISFEEEVRRVLEEEEELGGR